MAIGPRNDGDGANWRPVTDMRCAMNSPALKVQVRPNVDGEYEGAVRHHHGGDERAARGRHVARARRHRAGTTQVRLANRRCAIGVGQIARPDSSARADSHTAIARLHGMNGAIRAFIAHESYPA